jgi:hypothetical protein
MCFFTVRTVHHPLTPLHFEHSHTSCCRSHRYRPTGRTELSSALGIGGTNRGMFPPMTSDDPPVCVYICVLCVRTCACVLLCVRVCVCLTSCTNHTIHVFDYN